MDIPPSRVVRVRILGGYFYRQPLPGDDVRDIKNVDISGSKKEMTRVGGIAGHITNMAVFGKSTSDGQAYDMLYITLQGVGEQRKLSLFLDTQAARDILVRLPNIPLMEHINMYVWRDEKDYDRISIKTPDGESYKSAYTKDNPGDMPAWERTASGWDRTKLVAWMKTKIDHYNNQLIHVNKV